MQIKTDLNVAMRKDQFKINAGGKDLVTKTTWLLSALWYLHKLVILTSDNVSLSPTGQPTSCPAESMDRDGYPKSLLSRQQYYGTYHVDNSPNQGFYKLSKATNELQDALGLGRQVFRRGFFRRLHDVIPPQELAAPQDPPQVAMVAVPTTAPRPQDGHKENVNPQLAAHNSLTTRMRKPEDCNDMQTKAYAADQAMASIAHVFYACGTVLAQFKNRKAQKGTTASSVTQLSPPSYITSSGMENSEEGVHVANHVQACDHAVQSAKPEQSELDCFGLSSPRLSNKKRLEQSAEIFRRLVAEDEAWAAPSTSSSQLPLVSSTAEVREEDLELGPALPVMVDEEYSKNRLLPLIKGNTNAATLSLNSDEDLLELVSTSPDEEEDDRPRALPSIVYTGGKLSTTPGDNGRTRHVIIMDSVHCPDAVMSSGMVADGSVAYAKTTTTLYEQAAVPESTPSTSSRTSRKPSNNIGKRIGTETMVSKRSLRSGVMNRNNASRDESPSRRRRPSFNTTTPASRSPIATHDAAEDDQQAGNAGAAPTTFGSYGSNGDL